MLEGWSNEGARRYDRRGCDVSELEGVFSILGREGCVALVVVVEMLCLLLLSSASAALVASSSSLPSTVSSSSLTLIVIEPLLEGFRGTSAVL